MRATVVTPTTAMIRQIVIIKNGYLIAKPDIPSALPPRRTETNRTRELSSYLPLFRNSFFTSMHQQISCRNKKQCHQKRQAQSSDDGAGQRCVLLAACFKRQSQGDKPKQSRKCRHHYGSQSNMAGVLQRLE